MNGITRNLKEGLDLNKLHTTGADFELIAQEEPQIKEVDTKEEELYQERVMKYLNPECLDVQEEDRDSDGDANSNMVRVCVCLFVPTADCSKLASVENQQTVTTGHSSKKILLNSFVPNLTVQTLVSCLPISGGKFAAISCMCGFSRNLWGLEKVSLTSLVYTEGVQSAFTH